MKNDLHNIRRRVKRTIEAHGMAAPGEAILAAVSGGPDSMVMLDLLSGLTADLGIDLGVAHIDHNLRGDESRADADFVAEVTAAYNLPYHCARIDPAFFRDLRGTSLEEAARRQRYGLLEAIAGRHGYDRIAVGHNANDNAESVLLFLLRGSGPGGLGGIRPTIADRLIRPLIDLKRAEIERYIRQVGIRFVSDRSNRDLEFVRNRIRHRLLPLVQREFNPAVIDGLNRLATIARDEEVWLRPLISRHFAAAVVSKSSRRLDLSIHALQAMPRALQRRVLRMGLEEIQGNLRRVGFNHVEAVRSLCEKPEDEGSLHLPGNIRVRSGNTILTIDRGAVRPKTTGVPATPAYEHRIDSPDCTVVLESIGRRVRFATVASAVAFPGRNAGQVVAFFDMNKLVFPLVLRGVRAGDRFSPMGVHGSQKVKKFFIDHKVPKAERASCPVLISGGTIVWLVGHRIDDAYAATARSRGVLKVELLLV